MNVLRANNKYKGTLPKSILANLSNQPRSYNRTKKRPSILVLALTMILKMANVVNIMNAAVILKANSLNLNLKFIKYLSNYIQIHGLIIQNLGEISGRY